MGRNDRAGAPQAFDELKKHEGGRRSPDSSPHNVATPSRSYRAKDQAAGDKARGPASALEDLMRRKGVDEAWNALEEMQRQGVVTDKYTVSRMLMKTVGDGRSKINPSRVYRGIALVERFIELQPKDVDEVLFNALLDTCCRLKDLTRLEATVNRMRELKVSPSPVTLGILVKTYGQAGDLQKVLQVWAEMEKQRGQANAVTYGCMIDACVKCGHLEKAIEIFKGMRSAGKHRNTILYTTLIKGYGLEKDLKSALELFREMPQEGVPYNTITYNSILDACIKCGDLATAEGLLREMTLPESSLEPDLITFSTVLKGYCHVGDLDKALQVAETIKARGLRCDELVYNTLMDGCVKANDITAGVGLFEEMVHNGMKPSAITHSILARLYQRAGYEEDASEAVSQLYQHHGIERPSGGDRGKHFGRRMHTRSPNGGSARQSPIASPGTTSGMGMRRDSNFSEACSESGWSTWSGMPLLPGFDDHSAPSTPLAGSIQGSPANGNGLYLPVEALRSSCMPPLPGAGPDNTPYSSSSCTPVVAGCSPSIAGNVSGSPQGQFQTGMEQHVSFGMGPSPSAALSYPQQGFGMSAPQAQASMLPPWPPQLQGYAGMPPPPPQNAPEVGMQQQVSARMQMPVGAGMTHPHDMYGSACQQAGQAQAYFESWGGGGLTPSALGGMGGGAQFFS